MSKTLQGSSPVVDEAAKVVSWHIEMMVGLGIDPSDAIALAEDGVDWHDIKGLLDRGVPADLVPGLV